MILVTGGRGFIGAHTSRALVDLGADCVLGGRQAGPPAAFLANDVTVEQVDCTDLDSLRRLGQRHRITGIVHLAAAGIGGAVMDELRDSTIGLFNVLRAATEWGVDRVVLASTIGVYGGVTDDVYREDALLPIASVHQIPATKKIAEIVADAVELDVVSVRIGAIWGPLGRPVSRFFAAPQLVHAAANGTTADPVPADAGIDLCYVRDCGRAIALLQQASTLNHRTYNIGSGVVTTNRELVDAITRVVPDTRISVAPGGDSAARMDLGRLRADTGFAPAYDLDRAVADYLDWLRAGNSR